MFLLRSPDFETENLVASLREAKAAVRACRVCCDLTESEVCRICADPAREKSQICVVEEPQDVAAIERSRAFRGVYHGIATHDENMIRATIEFAQKEKIPPSEFEFQMLYGVRRDLQQKLVKEGWRCRVYIPFGTEWYPYLMRRLAERPANAILILKNLFR